MVTYLSVAPSRMPGRPHLLGLLLVSMLLAGCTGDDRSPNGGPSDEETRIADPGEGAPGSANGFLPPEWDVYDWWTYDTPREKATFVATADSPSDWTVQTDNDESAFFDALSDISTIGSLRKPDLAGQQGTTRVEYFQWPMQEDMEWTTTWDGELRTIRNERLDETRYAFTSIAADGTPHANYVYNHDIRWFESLTFYAPDGTEIFGTTFFEQGRNYTGPVITYSLDTGYSAEHAGDGAVPLAISNVGTTTFTADADATDIWFSLTVSCASGSGRYTVFPGDTDPSAPLAEQGIDHTIECPTNGTTTLTVPSVPGQWGVNEVLSLDPAAEVSVNVLVRTQTVTDITPDGG